ncbi:exopolygalacturonase [Quercus suber]|uniref:exopolygalacturonase n=1 Tax=Quercus suber TaxID=58331 RepID=UPI0032DE34BA
MGKNLSIATISLLLLLASTNVRQVFDVKSYGAQINGDITQALTQAWKAACAVARSKVVISTGTYKLGLVTLLGPCKGAIEFKADIESFKGKDGWVVFKRIDSLTVLGSGVFDGQGQMAWQKNNCAKKYNCGILPIPMEYGHNILCHNTNVTMSNREKITVKSENHNYACHQVVTKCDDCISIGDGTQDVTIKQVTCGPGHGISIGRLGRYQNEQPVSGIRVVGATLSNTLNGVRIKTWPASPSGIASDIHFENVIMDNVGNPILIDQNYCPNNQCSNESPSKVKISNVSFKNITGTSSTLEAVKLVCSKSVPCQQVVVTDIDLAYKGSGSATSTCVNVQLAVSGKQNPSTCTKKI